MNALVPGGPKAWRAAGRAPAGAAIAFIAAMALAATAVGLFRPAGSEHSPVAALPGLAIGRHAPDFTLPDLSGAPVHLAALRGRPVVLNFWSTTCVPCRREMPALQAAFTDLSRRTHPGSHRGNLIGINAGAEDRATIARFAASLGVSYPLLVDRNLSVSVARYHVYALPVTVALDGNGRVTASYLGAIDSAQVLALFSGG